MTPLEEILYQNKACKTTEEQSGLDASPNNPSSTPFFMGSRRRRNSTPSTLCSSTSQTSEYSITLPRPNFTTPTPQESSVSSTNLIRATRHNALTALDYERLADELHEHLKKINRQQQKPSRSENLLAQPGTPENIAPTNPFIAQNQPQTIHSQQLKNYTVNKQEDSVKNCSLFATFCSCFCTTKRKANK